MQVGLQVDFKPMLCVSRTEGGGAVTMTEPLPSLNFSLTLEVWSFVDNLVLSYLSFLSILFILFYFILIFLLILAFLDLVRPFLDLVRPHVLFVLVIFHCVTNSILKSVDIEFNYRSSSFPSNSSSPSPSIPPELFQIS